MTDFTVAIELDPRLAAAYFNRASARQSEEIGRALEDFLKTLF